MSRKLTADEKFEIFQNGRNVKPVANINGVDVYDNKTAQAAIMYELLSDDSKVSGNVGFNMLQVTPDGKGYRSSAKKYKIADIDSYYTNRYKTGRGKAGDKLVKEYHVVTDYRAIMEQSSGKCYTESILVYKIGAVKDDESGEVSLVFNGTKNITSAEFIKDYKATLDNDSMAEVLKVINDQANIGLTKDSISV